LSGTGAGVPLGLLNAPATIAVAKDTGQAAATLTLTNISGMWSRLPAPSRRNAVWLIHEDAETQLDQLSLVVGTGGSAASNIWQPAGTNGSPVGLLKGRPA